MAEIAMGAIGLRSAIDPARTASKTQAAGDSSKVLDAAQQFEALLIGQMLRTERESGNGWLGSGGDSAGDCATEYAEQQFASLLAQQGGLGLANLIAAGLTSAQSSLTNSSSRGHSSPPAQPTSSGATD